MDSRAVNLNYLWVRLGLAASQDSRDSTVIEANAGGKKCAKQALDRDVEIDPVETC